MQDRTTIHISITSPHFGRISKAIDIEQGWQTLLEYRVTVLDWIRKLSEICGDWVSMKFREENMPSPIEEVIFEIEKAMRAKAKRGRAKSDKRRKA